MTNLIIVVFWSVWKICIQKLLSTDVFPQIQFLYWLQFLYWSLRSLVRWWALKENILRFKYPVHWKMHFQHSFRLQKHSSYIIDRHDIFLQVLCFGDKWTQNCITQAAPYGAGYQRNGNYLCNVNKHGRHNYERSLLNPQNWPWNYVGLLSPDFK